VVLVGSTNGHLKVAMREGADPTALIELRRWLARPFAMEFVAPEAFDRLLGDNYAMSGEAAAANAGDLGIGEDLGHLAEDLSSEDLLDTSDNAPAIRLINGLIADAARQGVSDIHIEPYETGLVVRMRKDGVLQEALRLPPHVAPVVVSRIKVMARLDIAERRLPQDGRIGLTLGGKLIDVRVSTLPSRAGERVVLRILDKENAGIDLDVLGMRPASIPAFARRWASRTGSCWSPGRPDRARPRRFMRAEAAQRRQPQRADRRGPGRICDRRGRADADQPAGGAELRAGPARDPAPGPGRGDGRRNPRPRDGGDRRCRRR
jgi:general secretion pathway protein E